MSLNGGAHGEAMQTILGRLGSEHTHTVSPPAGGQCQRLASGSRELAAAGARLTPTVHSQKQLPRDVNPQAESYPWCLQAQLKILPGVRRSGTRPISIQQGTPVDSN